MRRPEEFADTRWDDPFWHVARMVVDLRLSSGAHAQGDIMDGLVRVDSEAANGLYAYLDVHGHLLDSLAWYLDYRHEAGAALLAKARTEDQALADFAELSSEVVKRYGTQSTDHHQSSKVMVQTVAVLTEAVCLDEGLDVDVDPQKRATIVSESHIWTSPRRLDGALPSLLNPVGLWEIKEYWGGTSGGSKMSDAIYECQLVGEELRTFEDTGGPRVQHYAILDGARQWSSRQADMRRAVDLLCSGLLDELLVGSEVMEDWPGIVRQLCTLVSR